MKIGFVGAGNMGGALIDGLLKSGKYIVNIYDVNTDKLASYKERGAFICNTISELCSASDIVVLTIKPNIYPAVLKELSDLNYSKKLVSVAPGVSLEFLGASLPSAQIIRTMPNTPAMVGEGMTLVAESAHQTFQNEVVEILNNVGEVSVIPETLLDAGTALSGSSPAMVYRLIDAMANGAVSHGIPKEKAVKIAAQAVLGSAKMVLESNYHPIELSDAVCSPGGTTIEMVNELEKLGFAHTIVSSMEKCIQKSIKMKK